MFTVRNYLHQLVKGNPAGGTAKDAYNDHKTKMNDIPQLYQYTQVLVASDGMETKYGSITSGWERSFVDQYSTDSCKCNGAGCCKSKCANLR